MPWSAVGLRTCTNLGPRTWWVGVKPGAGRSESKEVKGQRAEGRGTEELEEEQGQKAAIPLVGVWWQACRMGLS